MDEYQGLWFNNENDSSETASTQCSCEQSCAKLLKPFGEYAEEILGKFKKKQLVNFKNEVRLVKEKHAAYLIKNIRNLHRNFASLDASRPWIIYWILHACYLLSQEHALAHVYPDIISTLSKFHNSTGGFGGGPCQISHGAPTYGSVMSLCIIGTPEAYAVIDRKAIYRFFLSMKHANGGFCIHKDGEVDTRSTYTFLAVARVLNILTPELTAGVAEYLCSCQTYEGGFGGEMDNEAHGGYNFCALAALHILGQAQRCNLAALEYWLVSRQMKVEGGFQGRTNKLVDSCYSYWQGAAVALLTMIKNGDSDIADAVARRAAAAASEALADTLDETPAPIVVGPEATAAKNANGDFSMNQKALQRYVLHCAQDSDDGGLRDKPGKPRDFYHSCYALSGLSVVQYPYLPLVGSDGLPKVGRSLVLCRIIVMCILQ